CLIYPLVPFFFSSRRRHTRSKRDWSSDVCSSDLVIGIDRGPHPAAAPGSNRCHRPVPVDAGAVFARTVPAHSAGSPRSASPSPCGAESLGFFAESLASSPALSVFFGFALVSSLVLTVEAYVSTYSCPDSRMISYMISSVTDRSRKRSEGRPEYFEKSMGEPKTTPTRRSFGTSRPAGW